MAPRNGGVTNEAVTRRRTVRRSGMSVRATSQPIGAATTQQIRLVLKASVKVVMSGSSSVGSLTSVDEVLQRERAVLVGEAVIDQPRHRQHDEQAQRQRKAVEHELREIEAVRHARSGSDTAMVISVRHARPCAGHPRLSSTHTSGWPGQPGHDVANASHLENLRVALLDLLGVLLDAFGVFLHQLDVGELADAGLLDRLLVRRILPREVDQDLLALAADASS